MGQGQHGLDCPGRAQAVADGTFKAVNLGLSGQGSGKGAFHGVVGRGGRGVGADNGRGGGGMGGGKGRAGRTG